MKLLEHQGALPARIAFDGNLMYRVVKEYSMRTRTEKANDSFLLVSFKKLDRIDSCQRSSQIKSDQAKLWGVLMESVVAAGFARMQYALKPSPSRVCNKPLQPKRHEALPFCPSPPL